jgi:nitrous oxidase accessory protein
MIQMIRSRHLARAALVAAACLAPLLLVGAGSATTITVPPGASVQEAVDRAPWGGTVRLEPGLHQGPVLVRKPLALQGTPGARLTAPVEAGWVVRVEADRVRISALSTQGGSTGIFVQDADGVSIHDVAVHGPDLHGIEIVDASARITSVHVVGMHHPMAQGIEVRNADHRPETYVGDSVVVGGQEGLVSHVARVHFERNEVRDTTMRAITITERPCSLSLRTQ